MGMEPKRSASPPVTTPTTSRIWICLTALAALIGLALIVDASLASSATYDEVAYLRVATNGGAPATNPKSPAWARP